MSRKEEIGRRIAELQRAQERMLQELASVGPLEDFLEELPDESVVRFRYRYNGVGVHYHYASMKFGGKWYNTGRAGDRGRGSANFAEFLQKGDYRDLELATEWGSPADPAPAGEEDLMGYFAQVIGVPKERLEKLRDEMNAGLDR